jgi:hypothetical protein
MLDDSTAVPLFPLLPYQYWLPTMQQPLMTGQLSLLPETVAVTIVNND